MKFNAVQEVYNKVFNVKEQLIYTANLLQVGKQYIFHTLMIKDSFLQT